MARGSWPQVAAARTGPGGDWELRTLGLPRGWQGVPAREPFHLLPCKVGVSWKLRKLTCTPGILNGVAAAPWRGPGTGVEDGSLLACPQSQSKVNRGLMFSVRNFSKFLEMLGCGYAQWNQRAGGPSTCKVAPQSVVQGHRPAVGFQTEQWRTWRTASDDQDVLAVHSCSLMLLTLGFAPFSPVQSAAL